VLPNPNPSAGIDGCRGVAQFLADLSGVDSSAERRARIERFFFDGLGNFQPVLHPAHFTKASGGGIRTLQATSPTPHFFQFHLQQQSSRLLMVPGTLENIANPVLYNAAVATPLGAEFRQFFISQVATLAINDVNGFYERIPEKYLLGESVGDNAQSETNQGMSVAEGQAFKNAMSAELQRIGSNLTANDVLLRVNMQGCLGCHGAGTNIGNGLVFPRAQGGSHVSEQMETTADGTRHVISPALRDVFAPNRAKILADFLAGKPLPAHSN
jgi:hypothetical protein